MMSVDLYYAPMSAPCRAVMLTAEAVGIPLNLKYVNLFEGEHLTPEYEQLNPQKTIPFLVDGDYKLTESRAIMSYLVDQYGKNPRLYPHSPAARALVNQRLHFDIGTLYRNMAICYYPILWGGSMGDETQLEKLKSAFQILEQFLDGQDYVAGRYLTIADLAIATTVSTAEAFGFELDSYNNVVMWMDKVKSSAPGYRKVNGEGLEILKTVIEQRMQGQEGGEEEEEENEEKEEGEGGEDEEEKEEVGEAEEEEEEEEKEQEEDEEQAAQEDQEEEQE